MHHDKLRRAAAVNQKGSTMTQPTDPTITRYQRPHPSGAVQNEPIDPPATYGNPTIIDRRPDAGPVYETTQPAAGRDYMPASVYAEHSGVTDISRKPFDEITPKADPGGSGAQDAASAGYHS
jgi:hypothetical protein